MYMRAFVYRFVYVGVVSLGVALAAAFHQPVAHAAAAAQPGSEQTVVAPASLPIVTLSTVHVHADSARAATAKPAPAPVATPMLPDLVSSVATDHRGGGAAANLRLDMPYYSFGKMLPRVGKE